MDINEELTKARCIMLSMLRSNVKNAHTRNGTVCIYDDKDNLIFTRQPQDMWSFDSVMKIYINVRMPSLLNRTERTR